MPAGIFYYNIKDPVADREEVREPEDVEREILKQLRMSGLVNRDPEAVRHLDREIRCTLRILRAGGAECLYTLTGNGVAEQRTLYTSEGGSQAQAVFAGLEPGTYTLSDTDGLLRTVHLTEKQPEVVLGLD